MKRDIHDLLSAVIVAGMQDGSLAPGDPRLVAFTAASALNGIAQWYRPDGQMEARYIAQQTVDVLLAGLAARPTPET